LAALVAESAWSDEVETADDAGGAAASEVEKDDALNAVALVRVESALISVASGEGWLARVRVARGSVEVAAAESSVTGEGDEASDSPRSSAAARSATDAVPASCAAAAAVGSRGT
jgi:hypothetical protein